MNSNLNRCLLRKIKINSSGELLASEKAYFGGAYSFFDKIRARGVGSTKIIYESGIEEFDLLVRDVENEISFVNFELFKNGLILRVNRNQRIKCVGIKLSDINQIILTAFRIEIQIRRHGILETKIIHRGELEIIGNQVGKSKFSILSQDFNDLIKFLEKKEIKHKFVYTISTSPPEKDLGSFTELMDFL